MPPLTPFPINTLASLPALPTGNLIDSPVIQGAIVITKPSALPFGQQIIAQSVQMASLTVTKAQLLALKGADILIAPKPGVGLVIDAQTVSVRINFVSPAYTLNAGTLILYQGPSANAIPLTSDLSAILTQTATSDNVGNVALATGIKVQANIENQGLYLGNTGTAQFTLGGGSLDIIVTYLTYQM